jgi:hypothetical protein
MVALELLGMGIAGSHHGRTLGDTQIGLPQPHPAFAGQPVEPLDRRMQQLGVGREGDGLGCTVVSTVARPTDGENVFGTPIPATNSMPRQRLRSILKMKSQAFEALDPESLQSNI